MIRSAEATLLAVVAAAVTLPFLDKPFHIDDPVFLRMAENVLESPLHRYRGEFDWLGVSQPLWGLVTNPPLISFYAAPWVALGGFSEVVLHLAMIPFYLLLAASVLFLGKRFTHAPWFSVLFVMSSAGVVVSGNVTQDVPGAALASASVAAFLLGVDRGRRGWLVASGALAGLAVLMKYSAAIVAPLVAAYALLARRPGALLPWSLPCVAILGAWGLHNVALHGELHLASVFAITARIARDRPEVVHVTPSVVGSICFLFPLLLCAAVVRRDRLVLVTASLVLAGFAFVTQAYPERATDPEYLFWSIMGLGAVAICLSDGLRRAWPWPRRASAEPGADSAFLVAWLCAPFVFTILFSPFQAVRHVLPALPPLVLLAFRYLREPVSRPAWRALTVAVLTAQVALAFLLAAADYEYADAHRAFAASAAEKLGQEPGRIWYAGHWGWHFYAEREGFRQLHADGPFPAPGELLLWPKVGDVGRVQTSEIMPRFLPLYTISYDATLPLRTVGREANFYLADARRGSRPQLAFRVRRSGPVQRFHVMRLESQARAQIE
jgi:4-amino-4-deoxy-L-arabinose transferase-like glycosyltransferase